MLLIRCHGRCIDGKYRGGRQGLKNENLYRTTELASGHRPFSSLRPRAHVRVFACRRAAMDPQTTRGLRTGCDAPLQSVHPGRSACLSLHVRLPALSQPRLPRLVRRPQKEGETPLRKPDHRNRWLLRARRERPRCRDAEQRYERATFHVWMAPAWQEIIWRAAQRSLAVMCPACWCSPGGLLALMGSANRVLIIRTGSMSR